MKTKRKITSLIVLLGLLSLAKAEELNSLLRQSIDQAGSFSSTEKLRMDGFTGKYKPIDETSKWKVQDNALAIAAGAGDIYTQEAFEDFDLKLEWKSRGNSGIFIRVNPSHRGAI